MQCVFLPFLNILLLVWMFASPHLPCWGQSEKNAPAAPVAVRAKMKPGGISLRYLPLPQGAEGGRVWAHLYVVPPKGISPEGTRDGTPFTRTYIEENILPKPSPFYLDLFTESGKILQRRNTILFRRQTPPMEIQTRWRDPVKKRGLILLLDFRIGNAGALHVLPLDDHLRPLARQAFPFEYDTAEPDYRTEVISDQTDARGLPEIGVLVSEGEKKQTIWYEWKETAFVDPGALYFVVAAVRKTRGDAESFAARQQLQEYEIVATDDYKKKPLSQSPRHAYAVVVKRLRDVKQAEGYMTYWDAGNRKRYHKYTVLRGF